MTALGEDLLSTVNKLQDLVFNTIGSDSLDLPQIVRGCKIPILVSPLAANAPPLRSSWDPSPPENLPSSKTSSAATFCLEAAAS